jgi:carbonic anhydrase/acetyltransferase-like protein (isoleucine patch superfamily)
MGSPGKVVRTLTAEEAKNLEQSAAHYVANAARFSRDLEEVS